MAEQYSSVDEYIELFEPDTRDKMRRLRACVRVAAPEASEKISWRMPTFYLNGNLVHFAGFKKHIGFYPGDGGIRAFEARFAAMGLKYSKGGVQFPLSEPLPLALVEEIVRFRVLENVNR